MKFDHFGQCRALPLNERNEFNALKSSCRRKGINGNTNTTTNSTSQYYYDSAIQIGLVDTDRGIRFRQDILQDLPPSGAVLNQSLQIKKTYPGTLSVTSRQNFHGMSVLMLAATDPQIRAEFEARKIKGCC